MFVIRIRVQSIGRILDFEPLVILSGNGWKIDCSCLQFAYSWKIQNAFTQLAEISVSGVSYFDQSNANIRFLKMDIRPKPDFQQKSVIFKAAAISLQPRCTDFFYLCRSLIGDSSFQ